MTFKATSNPEENAWELFGQELEREYEQSTRSLNEIKLMLEQSQSEQSKLSQKNTAITLHLQQVQAQFETMPRADIRNAYNAALDTQQRLLVMRGQFDKLQVDYDNLQRYVAIVDKMRKFLAQGIGPKKSSDQAGNAASRALEMVVKAQETERQRLSRQMHDGPAQALSNFIVQTEIANRLLDIDSARAKEELDNLKNAAMGTFKEVRTFIFELRPMMLDDLGLFPTVRRYLDNIKEQTGSEVNLTLKGTERRLESYLEVLVFRALQELVGNAVRHNQDTGVKLQLNVQMLMDDTITKIAVADNGKGFDPSSLQRTSGVGLKLIRERVEMLGGTVEIDSDVGRGSRITFQVPTIEPAQKSS